MLVCHGEGEETGSVERLLVYRILSNWLSQCQAFVWPCSLFWVFFFSHPTDIYHPDPGESYSHTHVCPLASMLTILLGRREESYDTLERSAVGVFSTFCFSAAAVVLFNLPKFDSAESPSAELCRCSSSPYRSAYRGSSFRSLLTLALRGNVKANCPSSPPLSAGLWSKGRTWKKKTKQSYHLTSCIHHIYVVFFYFFFYITTLHVAQRIETDVMTFEPAVVYFPVCTESDS